MMKIGYYIKDHGDGLDEARTVELPAVSASDLEITASRVAEHIWDHEGGWEWMDNNGKVAVISLVVVGRDVGDFAITVESVPVFWARSIKTERGERHVKANSTGD